MPVVSITESLPEAATSVSLTALTRSDTGLTPTGVTLPIAFTDQGGGTAWGVSFTDPDALPESYAFTFRITWPDASTSDVSSSITPGEAVGFWTTQAQVEQQYGVDNCAQDVNLNDDGTGTAAVWQQALDWVDALVDRIFKRAGRPTDLTLADYKLASGYAGDIVRNQIHEGRGATETNGAGGRLPAASTKRRRTRRKRNYVSWPHKASRGRALRIPRARLSPSRRRATATATR